MGKTRSPRGRSPPVFSVRASLKSCEPLFRVLKPCVALPIAGWQPYTSRTVKRGVGPRVALCGRTWRSPWDWGRAGRQNHPKSTHHFFAQFLGQCRRSILQRDKGGWSLCALPPGNTAPQRGSGLRWRWSVFGLLAVVGGRNHLKSKDMPMAGRFQRWLFWVVYQNSGGKNVPKYKHSC